MEYFTVLTNTGIEKIAQATANKTTIDLSHIAVGDGNGAVPTPEVSQTQLINEVFRTSLSELKVDENNSNHIILRAIVPVDQGNFWIREVGIYDNEGDLIAVGNYPQTYKSLLEEGAPKEVNLMVILEVSNTQVMNLIINPSVTLASQAYVDEKLISKFDKKDMIQLITANCLLEGEINATQNSLLETLDIFEDGSCLDCYNFKDSTNSLGEHHATAVDLNYEDGIKFNGTTSELRLNIPKPNVFTLSHWYKRGNIHDSYIGIGRKSAHVGFNGSWYFRVSGCTFLVGRSQIHVTGNNSIDVSIDDDKYHFYSCTVDVPNATIEFYIDGEFKYSEVLQPNSISTLNDYSSFVGIMEEVNHHGINGSIKQLRLFNRKLTATEQKLLYKEEYLTDIALNNAAIVYSNGRESGSYKLTSETVSSKTFIDFTFKEGWNEIIKTKEGNYRVIQNLSYIAEKFNGSDSNRFSIDDGKYYDKDDVHLENQAPILHVLYDGANIIEIKKIMDFIGFKAETNKKSEATAWAIIDGTTTPPTIKDSYNISDVVLNALGKFKLFFEENMDTMNYSTMVTNSDQDTHTQLTKAYIPDNIPPELDGVTLHFRDCANNTFRNEKYINVQVFGGKN